MQPTVLAMVPPLVSFLATHPMVKSSHLASDNVMTGGAAPFGPALIDKFLDKCKPNVVKFREGEYSSHGARYGYHKLVADVSALCHLLNLNSMAGDMFLKNPLSIFYRVWND